MKLTNYIPNIKLIKTSELSISFIRNMKDKNDPRELTNSQINELCHSLAMENSDILDDCAFDHLDARKILFLRSSQIAYGSLDDDDLICELKKETDKCVQEIFEPQIYENWSYFINAYNEEYGLNIDFHNYSDYEQIDTTKYSELNNLI